MTEFFRHCPGCGRRFHVKLESKQLIGGHRAEFSGVPAGMHGAGRSEAGGAFGGNVFIDINEYQYTYKCQLCGHEWSEKRLVDELESAS